MRKIAFNEPRWIVMDTGQFILIIGEPKNFGWILKFSRLTFYTHSELSPSNFLYYEALEHRAKLSMVQHDRKNLISSVHPNQITNPDRCRLHWGHSSAIDSFHSIDFWLIEYRVIHPNMPVMTYYIIFQVLKKLEQFWKLFQITQYIRFCVINFLIHNWYPNLLQKT